MSIDIDRMKRHSRGTKPLRGQARRLARARLSSGFVRHEFPGYPIKETLDGHSPWPPGLAVPFGVGIRGGAR